jgi:hypothetical protein
MQSVASKSSANKDWQLRATYVEIYNEQLRDLLLPENTPLNERPTVNIREDRDGRILLTGLTQKTISSAEELLDCLNWGSAIRQTDATAVNAKSSRSHAVFSLNLVQKKTSSGPTSTKEKRRSVPIEMMSGSTENWITVDRTPVHRARGPRKVSPSTPDLQVLARSSRSFHHGLEAPTSLIATPGSPVFYKTPWVAMRSRT